MTIRYALSRPGTKDEAPSRRVRMCMWRLRYLETSSARRLHSHVPKSNLQTPAATRSLHETYTTNVLHVSLDVRAYEHAMGSREPLCVCDATAAWQRFDFRAEWPHGACQRMYSSNLPTRYEYGMNSHAGTCTGPEGEASGVPSRLGAVVTDLAAQWAACPDSDLEGIMIRPAKADLSNLPTTSTALRA